MTCRILAPALTVIWAAALAAAPSNVLLVVNENSAISSTIGDYYVLKRRIPLANVCRLRSSAAEEISRQEYTRDIAAPIGAFLRAHRLQDRILYIVTTQGVPLRVQGNGSGLETEMASVDSELTLLYAELHGAKFALKGHINNPFFAQTLPFTHARFPIYLVTRLAGYDFADVKGLIDRSLQATNTGKFEIDLKAQDQTDGNSWLRRAANALPRDRVVLEDSGKVLMNQKGVIGYASWGSNDPARSQREIGFHWLPGAIVTEFVSTDARTFLRPPDQWKLGNWGDPRTWFAGSPQSLTADYIHSGATGASGNVYEPYLSMCVRPDLLFPAYYGGRNLAESYYLATPALSWMNVVIGDPLCSLGKPN